MDISIDKLRGYLCQQTKAIYNILEPMKADMEELELMKLYEEVELPLIEVLATMEFKGIKVDKDMLEDLKINLKRK